MSLDRIRISRWSVFILALTLIYTGECGLFLMRFADTVPKFLATVAQLFLLYRLGKDPRNPPIVAYSVLLPLMLGACVAGNYLARPNYFVFPLLQLALSWLLLQLPVFLWGGKKGGRTADLGILPIIYMLILFMAYFWRLPSDYASGSFVHYEFTPCYTWLSLLLPQFVCCSAGMRRLIRSSLTRINLTRTLVVALAGLGLVAGWEVLSGLLFRVAGLSVTVLLLGPTVPADAYTNPVVAIVDHLMLISGTYIYVAIAEEVFFRLILPGFLRTRLRLAGRESFWTTFFVSALIFGSIHWLQASPVWTKVLYSCVSGMIFAALRHYSRNLQASSVVHAITNDFPRLIWV